MIEKFVSGAKVLEFDSTSECGLRLYYGDDTTQVIILSRYEDFDDDFNVKMLNLKTNQQINDDYVIAEQQWDDGSEGIPDRIVIIPKEEAHL